jgi:hypothetical protein
MEIVRDLKVSIWSDSDILIGQNWDEAIVRAIAKADFGLLLVSPALLSSDYIRRVEIPSLITGSGTSVMPVGLQSVNFDRCDMQGLEAHQIFRYRDPHGGEARWFADLAGENRARFCDSLVGEIVDRLLLSRP